VTYRDAISKLKALGCVELVRRGGGSHRKWQNPGNGMTAAIPDWGNKDLKLGTVRAVVRQLGLDWKAFQNA
jgi:predicted RNA binding protein YcfA (HicA-like mRNA interferase family)